MAISSIGSSDILTTALSNLTNQSQMGSSTGVDSNSFAQLLSSMVQQQVGTMGNFSDSSSSASAMSMMGMGGLGGLGGSSSSENIVMMMMLMQMMQNQDKNNASTQTQPSGNTGSGTVVSGQVTSTPDTQGTASGTGSSQNTTTPITKSPAEKITEIQTNAYAKVQAYRDFASGLSGTVRNIVSSRIDGLI